MNTLADKIKRFREQRGLNQAEIADSMGMSRPTYVLVETGKKQLTVPELNKLASALHVSLEEILFDTTQQAIQDFGIDKYKQIILNCLRYGADDDGRVTKTKLAKLSYLADFAWFYNHLKPMSGLSYRRIQQGPVPDQYFRIIDELFDAGIIKIEHSGNAMMISPTTSEEAPKSQLSSEEVSLIKKISSYWQGKPTQDVVDFTHSQIPWKVCRQGELIPYELITQEDPNHVYQP